MRSFGGPGIPVGFGPSIFKLSPKLGEGAAGRAVLSGRGAIYNSREEVLAVIGEASPDTYKHFQEASDGPRAPHAAASAPLMYKGKALGALVVDAFQNKGGLVPEDLEMLERFAQIAAIAIVNARLYKSEHANRVRLEVLNNEITRRRDELERSLRPPSIRWPNWHRDRNWDLARSRHCSPN